MTIPILPVVYFATIFSVFGAGYYYGWRGEYDEVVRLELQLNDINAQSQRLLADTMRHNDELTAQQQKAIAELENKYHETIQNNDNLYDQLVNVQRVRRTATSAARDCHAMPKADNSARSEKIDVGGRSSWEVDTVGFSERLDTFVSRKALQADKLDADRRLLLDWIKTIPKDMVEQ